MADQTPFDDPIDNRLRATFAAEHADIERRHLANEQSTSSPRSWKWVPFAVAAALIAIAGFAFVASRNTDQAIDLDIAAQTPDDEVPGVTETGDPMVTATQVGPAPTPPPSSVAASVEPALVAPNAVTGHDSLELRPCTQGGAPEVNPENDQLYLPTSAGDQSSTADHVHDIRTESNDTCSRIVVTFGENANEDADGPAAILPPIIVYKGDEFVRISPNGWAMESAFMDPDRIDYPSGIGLLAINPGFNFSVELMHREMEPHVRFLDNPARVVVDLFPVEAPDPTVTGPFGEQFVLRAPIQSNLTGNEVFGFGRPFEAAGLYRIWSVPDDVDADEFLAEPPAPDIEAFFPTSGWAEGWGSFNVDLPELAPGTYIAVFGELPPTDEIGFYGTGQLFRITEAGTVAPDAVLLPDVQLLPE